MSVKAPAVVGEPSSPQVWYVCWPLNRVLRDQLEPLLLINSGAALMTLCGRQLHIQLVDRFFTSVFQRTFWAGTDYFLSTVDPLNVDQDSRPFSDYAHTIPNEKTGAILWEAPVEIGVIHDILSGSTPSTLALLANGTKTGMGSKNEPIKVVKTSEDDEDEEEDETLEKKKSQSQSHSLRGRRATIAACEREEQAVWRFSCSSNPVSIQGTMDVKVRFVVLQTKAKQTTTTMTNGGIKTLSFTPFDTPWPAVPTPGFSSVERRPMTDSQMNNEMAGSSSSWFVKKTTGWEKVPLIGSAPAAIITPVLEFAPSFPPRYYRFDQWLNVSAGAKVSLRCTSDLQDDLMNLVTFSETCHLSVTDGDMQLVAHSKRGKKAYVLRYEQPFEFDATPGGDTTAGTVKKPKKNNNSNNKFADEKIVLPRRPIHNTPRFYVEYIRKHSLARTLRCSFSLRPFRIIHKLIGSSSRIEWIVHSPKPPLAGPLICTFYHGTLATERLAGVLMSIRLPPH